MPDRWVAWCRRLVPEPLRTDAFDPTAEDLLHAACLSRTPHRTARVIAGARLKARVLLAALECRRLAALSQPPTHGLAAVGSFRRGTMIRDLVTVTRRLWREPRFTAAVVLTLALGLGANLTVFTFVDAYLIAPLPVPQPGELLRVSQDRGDGAVDLASYPNYRDGRDDARGVIDLAAHTQTTALVGPPDAGEVRPIEVVSGNYFRVLRLRPQVGRLLTEADDLAELASPVVVVSDGFWRSRLGARPDAVGTTLFVNGARFDIVGVAPPGFNGTFAAHRVDLWAPITMQQHVRPRGLSIDRRGWGWLWMIGRLTPGHGPADAERALAVAAGNINRRFPPSTRSGSLAYVVQPVSALSVADQRRLTPVLLTAFAFTALLFIATCANLAGLMHARVSARRKELAVRQSLGAGRLRLMWEWMVECTLLALAGGVAALAVARLTAEALGAVQLPPELLGDLTFDTTLQWRVVFYTLGVSLVGALLFGASSAWRAARQVPVEALKEEGGNASGGRRSVRARRAMVAVQVGVSVVLLMLASLLTTSLRRQQQASPGFETSTMGVLSVHLQRQRVPEGEWPGLTQRALDAARAVPGVEAADLGLRAPLEQGEDVQTIRIPGYDPQHEADGLSIDFNQVGPTYFDTLGLRFESGGPWDPRNGAAAVVINHTMAARYWPGTDPVGRTVLIGRTPATVSGVVADSSYYSVGEPPRPYIYLPAHVQPPGRFVLHVRTAGTADPAALMTVVAKALAAADARLAPFDVMAFNELRQVPLFPTRLLTMAAMVFGAVSVVLTVVGLYGVVAASVSARTREIGVRLALGAEPDRVQRGIIGEALTLAAAGGAAGLGAGYVAAHQLRGWLFDVAPFDLAVTIGVVVAVAVLAAGSAWIPARRAARVDPVRAMR